MFSRRLTWVLIILTLLFIIATWSDAVPALRGPTEWRWNLRDSLVPVWRIVFPIGLLGLYSVICARWIMAFKPDPPSRRFERWFLIFLTLAAPLIQLSLAAAVWRAPLFEFFSATISPSVTGFYSVAVTTPDLPTQLAHYTTLMPTLPIHPQTHPPGLVMIQWLAWRLFQAWPALSDAIAMPLRTLQCQNVAVMGLDNPQLASATIGMLVPVLGGFTVWPMYAFGRRVIGSRNAALAVAIFALLPMFAMWPGQWDQVYPLLLFAGLYFLHVGLEARSNKRIFTAGLLFSVASFLSIGNMIMTVIACIYGVTWYFMRIHPRHLMTWDAVKQWSGQAIAFILGCVSIWLAYAVLYQVNFAELMAVAERLAFEGTRCPICPSTHRTYSVWVIWNMIDFGLFLGVPIAVLCLTRLKTITSGIWEVVRQHSIVVWVPLTVATVGTFVLFNLSGIVRGEVSRIWSYFGPLFLLIAFLPRREDALKQRASIAWLIGLIAAQLIVMNTRWLPYPSFLNEPPERTANFNLPDWDLTHSGEESDVSFDQQIKLAGYSFNATATAIDLTLYWQALIQPQHAYTIFVHVLDANGQLIGQQDNMPMHDQLPTSCWQPHEIVTDEYHIPIKQGAAQSIAVGLYRLDTGQRLTRDDGQGDSWLISVPES